MSTVNYLHALYHTNDADFRAWAGDLHNALITAGLVATADTGQADFTTVARPPVFSSVYKVYRFDDTLQGTRPVFLRINYGTGSNALYPAFSFVLGSGSDGSGDITGAPTLALPFSPPTGPSSAASARTLVSVTDGFLGICFGIGAAASLNTFLAIGRSVGSDGEPSAEGLYVVSRAATTNGGNVLNCIRYAESSVFPMTSGSSCLNVGGGIGSTVGSNVQVYKHYAPFPRVRPVPWLLTVNNAELGALGEFQVAPIGGKIRNYITLGSSAFNAATFTCALPTVLGLGYAMVWEA